MTDTQTVTRSRWGFHPCDYQTYLDLKQYHWYLYLAYCGFRRWHAWSRRLEENRTGPEPKHYTRLVVPNVWHGHPEFASYGGAGLYHHVLDQYRSARTPVQDPALVRPLDLPDGWRSQLDELRRYFTDLA